VSLQVLYDSPVISSADASGSKLRTFSTRSGETLGVISEGGELTAEKLEVFDLLDFLEPVNVIAVVVALPDSSSKRTSFQDELSTDLQPLHESVTHEVAFRYRLEKREGGLDLNRRINLIACIDPEAQRHHLAAVDEAVGLRKRDPDSTNARELSIQRLQELEKPISPSLIIHTERELVAVKPVRLEPVTDAVAEVVANEFACVERTSELGDAIADEANLRALIDELVEVRVAHNTMRVVSRT
jgi:hypothetical protein